MTDLVKRLRKGVRTIDDDRMINGWRFDTKSADRDMKEAADEIERLETYYKAEYEIVDRIWKVLGIETFEDAKGKEISELVQDKLDEIERLEAELDEAIQDCDCLGVREQNDRLREALKRQLRHTLNSDLPRAPQDYVVGIKALEGNDIAK